MNIKKGMIIKTLDKGIQFTLSDVYLFNGSKVVEVGQPFVNFRDHATTIKKTVKIDLNGHVKWSGVAYIPVNEILSSYSLSAAESPDEMTISENVIKLKETKSKRRRKRKVTT